MNLLTALLSQPTQFSGHGTNHEGEDFVGRLEMQPLVNASALMLDGELRIAHSWGMPGGTFAQRSHCTLYAISA